ncbi:hypothetical protein DVA67_032975 [Solirubrobacter sp. CPCC 204708]|uniref:Carboxypeptidase regulatory-like domain-containing protein n=1 Tax=Solirubrobacter deserti TaxID=2282478 RepID=A0ABT4RIS6_9ACTN|nr:hypothetical protein [Solirubrobacter deserti]MBE2320819.1 hypothetical protein [Solirubrobacter deserti]MDA0138454.1 hypothetical protein [Solirubrobacter deserti]
MFIAVLLVACGVVFLHFALGGLSCAWDTSYCAESPDKTTEYRGRLQTQDGRVLADTEFSVEFESRLDEPVGGFRTDADGDYCVRWAREAVSPNAVVGDELVGRLEIPEPEELVDETVECQSSDASIPWNRTEQLRSTPQFLGLFVPGVAAIALLVFGLVRPHRAVFYAGCALTAVTCVGFAALWFV